MENLRELRNAISVLSDKIPQYFEILRLNGFVTCFVNEDWMRQVSSREEINLHDRYLIEMARETLASDKPAEIIYTDSLDCRSSFLNELKRERILKHGTIDFLNSGAGTMHLKELSPCVQKLMKLSYEPSGSEKLVLGNLIDEFSCRRKGEMEMHREKLGAMRRKFPTISREAMLQDFFAEALHDQLVEYKGRVVELVRPRGRIKSVIFDLVDDVALCILPNVICGNESSPSEGYSGRTGVGFRLLTKEAIASPIYRSDEQIVLDMACLLPSGFGDYGVYDGREEFCLNVLAWQCALGILIHDVLSVFQKR